MVNITHRVLILDAETRAALATVRSLGKAGIRCSTASNLKYPIASSSRYSRMHLHCPDIRLDAKFFFTWLLETIDTYAISTVLPMTDATIEGLGQYASKLSALVHYPVVPTSILGAVQDKLQLTEMAKKTGILVPKTFPLTLTTQNDPGLLETLKNELGYPFMLKPRQSVQVSSDGSLLAPPRKVIRSDSDFLNFTAELKTCPLSFIAQEFIPGWGAGIFCLFSNNKPVLTFAHKRLLEKPPEGGVSVLSESFFPPQDMVQNVHSLLDSYGWEGVAMTEFRITPDGKAYLMEINPRFWGSLQLAVDAGCNFPLALLKPETVSSSNSGYQPCRLRWELGTLDHILIVIRQNGILRFLKKLFSNEFMFFARGIKTEVFRLSDPRPFLTEMKNYFSQDR
jgi:predicted ATP-grasp superfamily ATP-dependent carboligase